VASLVIMMKTVLSGSSWLRRRSSSNCWPVASLSGKRCSHSTMS